MFMSAFEVMCWGWGFAPSLSLFRACFKILKANNGFLNFCGRNGLAIYIGHKDCIKHWVDSFAIVGAKRNFDWGLELGWSIVDTFCNAFPFLSEWEQLYFIRIFSFHFKYDAFKCLDILPEEDCYAVGI